MNAEKTLKKIQSELKRVAFKKLKELGLVKLSGQVEVKIKLRQQVYTQDLSEDDWKNLLELDLSPQGRKLIERMRDAGNEPQSYGDGEETDPDYFGWRDRETLSSLIRSRLSPLYLAKEGPRILIRKRLVA